VIIESSTKVERRIVCVDGAGLKFPAECLLCGATPAAPTPVEFKKIYVLIIVAGGETFTFHIPLCQKHAETYVTRQRRVNLAMNVSCIIAFGGLSFVKVMSTIYTDMQRKLPAWHSVADPLAMTLAVIFMPLAILLLLSKNSLFPVKLLSTVFRNKAHLRFRFPDDESMRRFIAANAGLAETAENKEPVLQHKEKFD
jgi:hypothetical protein